MQYDHSKYVIDSVHVNSIKHFSKPKDSPQRLWEQYENVNFQENSLGFRSREFEKLNKNDFNVLYAGCSITYGHSLPTEHMWSTNLTNKIKEKQNSVKDFNISHGGHSIRLIIKNTMAFIRNYGKPDYIFMILPQFGRSVHYYKFAFENVFHPSVSYALNWDPQTDHAKHCTMNDLYFEDILLLATFIDYCKEAGINLLVAAWDGESYSFAKNSGISLLTTALVNPVMAPSLLEDIYGISSSGYEEDMWVFALDKEHPGIAWNLLISILFFKEFMEIYEKN